MTSTLCVATDPALPSSRITYDYVLYGFRIRTSVKLTLQEAPGEGADIELLPAAPDWFENAISQVKLNGRDWVQAHETPEGWSYVRYDGMFDFLVASSGDRIYYRLLGPFSLEAFQTYALGRVFSLALVKRGIEPLHASTVVVNGRAVAFLGASTFGKSSLAACFVAGQHPLLTDDVLRLREESGRFLAFPGPPRLKLLPSVARLFLGDAAKGVPMDHRSSKFVFPLLPCQSYPAPVPLAVIYTITAPRDPDHVHQIKIQRHAPEKAFLKVLSFTHNGQLSGKERLRKHFVATQRVVDVVPVRMLAYPRVLSSLPAVREAVLADLERSNEW